MKAVVFYLLYLVHPAEKWQVFVTNESKMRLIGPNQPGTMLQQYLGLYLCWGLYIYNVFEFAESFNMYSLT